MKAPALVGDTWIGTGSRRLAISDFAGLNHAPNLALPFFGE